MIVKCKNCSMNEYCICIPSADECLVRKESYEQAIDDFVTVILAKFTEAERNGNFRFYASELKQSIADLGEQLKG